MVEETGLEYEVRPVNIRNCEQFKPEFLFQAEDGIRDRTVTGVQTCALPISRKLAPLRRRSRLRLAVACQSDVVELTGELGGERRPRLDTDLGGRLRDLGDDCVGDPGPAGGLFERRRIVLGNTAEVVLTLNVGARGIAHREQ